MKALEKTMLGLSVNGILEIIDVGEIRVSQAHNLYRVVNCKHYEYGSADINIKVICFNHHAMLFERAEEGQFMFVNGKLENAYQHIDDTPMLTIMATWAMPIMDADIPMQEELDDIREKLLDEKKNGWKKTYKKTQVKYEDWQSILYPETDDLEKSLDDLTMKNLLNI